MSDIGGQLGLWLGFSVMSLLEIIELIYLMTHDALKGTRKKNETTQVEPEDNEN